LAEIAAEFVRLKVDVILATGTAPALAAKQATSVIPTVFAFAGDPLGTGLVASLKRPGGNVTGQSNQGTDLVGKRIELLREIVPHLRRLAVLANAGYPAAMLEMEGVQTAARTLGLEVAAFEVRQSNETLAARLPTIYVHREYVDAGGLISYGANFPDLFRRAAEIVDKVLRGAKPADIPVEQPTKFELVINLTTAKALGLDVPPTVLARADEVIE
jgi:putative ABC transport system substrate-binding protein